MDEKNIQEEKMRELFKSLTDEQKEKIKACKTPEEVVNLIQNEGFELPDDALDLISGGYPRDNPWGNRRWVLFV